ncbi:gp5 [Sclerotinia sclerotiorum negative-stranded RNA virus 2A]|uniref:Gp5 n=1 Tax=Sclerotinia sclerotiorum negative-stranded RNA virus 2A TaxID=3071284 RepID=A0A2Z4QKK8_9MONO|nr:gp5 [Sclerotinia sclerotiorum negative-stranded RNA virus 2-A]AWY11021.1 gp5 [Sclerotinia sclerotiorum negative-stranded RNA virus 2-A]
MSPSYKEKLSIAESKLKALIEGGALESLEKAKFAFIHSTVQAKTQSLLVRIKTMAELHSLRVPQEPPSLPYEADWLTTSAQAIRAIEVAEILVGQLSDQLMEAKRRSTERAGSKQLDVILRQIQLLEDAAISPPSNDCLLESPLSSIAETFKITQPS